MPSHLSHNVKLNKNGKAVDINAETYRFWNRQLQNSVIIPTPSPTTAAPTAPSPVSVSQNWCGDVCIDASDLNNAEETINAYRRAVAVDGQDINNIDVTFSNGSPCVASEYSSSAGRKLQAVSEAREIIVRVSDLEPTFNTGEPANTVTFRDKLLPTPPIVCSNSITNDISYLIINNTLDDTPFSFVQYD